MTARAMFRASLVVGGTEVPVRLYAAAQDTRVHFRLLHAEDGVPVQQKMVDPSRDEAVEADEIQRALEVGPGRFVILTDSELDAIAPETDRKIPLDPFVDRGLIDPAWYDRPYYLGPDGDDDAYDALVEALEQTGRAGICRWSMRKKRYLGAVQSHAGHLLLMTLRTADQVVLPSELASPGGAKLDDKHVALAEQLVSTLDDDFEPDAFENDDRERVRRLLEAKRKGEAIPTRKARRKPPTDDIADALQRSLKNAKGKGRGKAKAKAKAKAEAKGKRVA